MIEIYYFYQNSEEREMEIQISNILKSQKKELNTLDEFQLCNFYMYN